MLLALSHSSSLILIPKCIQLYGTINHLLLAGHETSSLALTWTLNELTHNPNLQATLRREVQQAYLDAEAKSEAWPSCEALAELPFLDAVVVRISLITLI